MPPVVQALLVVPGRILAVVGTFAVAFVPFDSASGKSVRFAHLPLPLAPLLVILPVPAPFAVDLSWH